MDIKKLKELYDQYKKIKGYDVGGEVQEVRSEDPSEEELKQMNPESQAFYNAKKRYGRENSLGLKHRGSNGETEGVQSYADGGEVKKDDDSAQISQSIVDTFKKAFNPSPTPSPSPKDDDSLEAKYQKIRAQNKANFGYAEGGEVEDKPGLSPEQFEQHLASLQKMGYKLTPVQGDEQDVNAEAPSQDEEQSQPASEQDVSPENPDDKALESQMQNEELEGQIKADDAEKEPETEKKDESEPKSDTSEESQPESEQPEPDTSSFSRLLASVKPEASAPTSANALAEAQKQRDQNLALAQLQRGTAIMGAGMAGRANVNPALALTGAQAAEKYANLPVQKYEEQLQNQQNDAGSDVSKVVRDYMQAKGMKVPDTASAADLFKVAPFLQKDQALQGAMQKVLLQTQSREKVAASNQTAMDARAKAKNLIEQQKADAMKANAEANRNTKESDKKDKTMQQTKTMLESARGNPAAAQAEKDLYSVDKANSIFKIYPNLDSIPDAQVNTLITEVGKIAQGGVPTGHELESLKPNTPESRLAKLWGQLTNKPNGAQLGAYLKELKKYNDALKGDAKKVIQEKYGRVIESSKKQLGDENYKSLQEQYLNRFNNSEAPAVDADLTKMTPDQLKAYIKAHGGQ